MLKYFLLTFSVFLLLNSAAQRKMGSWQDYLSYTEATKIAVSANKVFCATSGGLFYFDLQDNSVNKISEIMKLSDFGIKTIAYNASKDVLVVAYNNSNIDLVYNTRWLTFLTLSANNLQPTKL